jgi:hemerythrin-like domain-containing protein
MNTLTDAVRRHHQILAKTLAAYAAERSHSPSERDAFVEFLKHDLIPHARGEEHHLYPRVDELVRIYGQPTATMTVDHEFIADYVSRIARAAHELATEPGSERRESLTSALHELAVRLDAILELHLAKEERVYLPLIEQHIDEAGQRGLLQAVHDSAESCSHAGRAPHD